MGSIRQEKVQIHQSGAAAQFPNMPQIDGHFVILERLIVLGRDFQFLDPPVGSGAILFGPQAIPVSHYATAPILLSSRLVLPKPNLGGRDRFKLLSDSTRGFSSVRYSYAFRKVPETATHIHVARVVSRHDGGDIYQNESAI